MAEQIHYAGKTLPEQAGPPRVIVPDPRVNYDGYVLPAQAGPVKTNPVDPTNNPSLVYFKEANVYLPNDCIINFPDENILVQTQILDGVSVFERINRGPAEIEFEFTLRMQQINGVQYNGVLPPAGLGLSGMPQNIFPQSYIEEIWKNIFIPQSVHTVTNTLLNGIGIFQVVIKGIHPYTVRGSTNVPVRIRAYENVYGLPPDISNEDAASYAAAYSGFI